MGVTCVSRSRVAGTVWSDTRVHVQGGGDPSGTAPKGGLASLLRRAVQQAKAEAAAAQVQGSGTAIQDVVAKAKPGMPEQAAKPAGGDKRALSSMLMRAAQRMQQQQAAVQSEQASASFASPALMQQWLDAAELDGAPSVGLVEAEQPQAQAGTIDGSDRAPLSAISRASSFGSALGLLPERPPDRKPSLGERLSAVLRGTLSLPRQSSYVAVGEEDDATAATSDLSPVRRRALPRDASYLPEWLNRTLSSSSVNLHLNDSLETQELLQEEAEDGLELPEWVNWSTMSHKEDAAPVKQRPAPLALLTDGTPTTQPVSESDSEPAAAQAPPTPKGHRLFEFWQQKSAAAAAAGEPVNSHPLPASPLPPAHARRRQPPAQKVAAETLLSGHTRVNAPPTRQQLSPNRSHEAATGLPVQHQGLQAQQSSASLTPAEFAAELAATSRLVQQQSERQAEMLEGLEHALSQLSQHRLLIENPTAQLEQSEMEPYPGMVVCAPGRAICAIETMWLSTSITAVHGEAKSTESCLLAPQAFHASYLMVDRVPFLRNPTELLHHDAGPC